MKESNKPEYLEKGEVARLIPGNAPGAKEVKATSVLLSCLSAVPDFSDLFFRPVNGVRIGSRTKIDCYTEVSFKNDATKAKKRPDGLIIIESGKNTWRALVESKVGGADLDEQQIKDYLALAQRYGINALITFSNQYVAVPTNHPVTTLKKQDIKGVDLYHFSWASVITDALLCLKQMDDGDKKDQKFILNEVIEYFNHPQSSISNFEKMNQEWNDLCQHVKTNAALLKDSDEVKNTISSWHQETKDLSLIMSRLLHINVTLNLSKKYQKDSDMRLQDDCRQLVEERNLSCILDIPGAAGSLRIKANLSTRTIECGMQLFAPDDKKTPKARLNWLTRQLQNRNLRDIYIRASAPRLKNSPQGRAEQVMHNPGLILGENDQILPHSFDVILIRDVEKQFGRSTFIKSVEGAVQDFYTHIGQYLKAWVRPAPKVEEDADDAPATAEETAASDASANRVAEGVASKVVEGVASVIASKIVEEVASDSSTNRVEENPTPKPPTSESISQTEEGGNISTDSSENSENNQYDDSKDNLP